MKWKTKDNEIIDISDMSDLHIKNAIKYCQKNGDFNSLDHLLTEQRNRNYQMFMSKTEKCKYCDGIMKMQEIYSEYSANQYRLVCNKCGASSNQRTLHEINNE